MSAKHRTVELAAAVVAAAALVSASQLALAQDRPIGKKAVPASSAPPKSQQPAAPAKPPAAKPPAKPAPAAAAKPPATAKPTPVATPVAKKAAREAAQQADKAADADRPAGGSAEAAAPPPGGEPAAAGPPAAEPPAAPAPPSTPAAAPEAAPEAGAPAEPTPAEPAPGDDAFRRRAPAPAAAPAPPPAYVAHVLAGFRGALAPYGTWTQDGTYGTVWVPNVGEGFAPYLSDGQWALAPGGAWKWLSRYPWGNIPFHYGRWIWLGERRWAWVPDTEFAPAWVLWRVPKQGHGFIGWAPMPPRHPAGPGEEVMAFWFVPSQRLFQDDLPRFVVRDDALGQRLMGDSEVLPAHLRGGSRGLLPATPLFEQTGMPAYLRPPAFLGPGAVPWRHRGH
ncbi:MAG: hypothetical protein HY744_32565 [Deltaproteobacteria bacterium]|nr:hypothetical protein [Deltaproteobacteria bacterium]